MKQKFLTTALAAIACLWLATAYAATPNPQFLGTWVMDVSKMQPAPPVMPKSVTVTTKDVGGGKWVNEMVAEMPDGKHTRPGFPVSIDGTPTPIPGNPMMDSVKVTAPDANTMVITGSKSGKTVQTETYKLSANGKQLFLTSEGTAPDGKPVHRTETFNRKSG